MLQNQILLFNYIENMKRKLYLFMSVTRSKCSSNFEMNRMQKMCQFNSNFIGTLYLIGLREKIFVDVDILDFQWEPFSQNKNKN